MPKESYRIGELTGGAVPSIGCVDSRPGMTVALRLTRVLTELTVAGCSILYHIAKTF